MLDVCVPSNITEAFMKFESLLHPQMGQNCKENHSSFLVSF